MAIAIISLLGVLTASIIAGVFICALMDLEDLGFSDEGKTEDG